MKPIEIYTAASNMTKPKKAELHSRVIELIEKGEHPSAEDLAALYSFFLPSRPARSKTPWDWVTLAVADKKDGRDWLQYVHVMDELAYASNGHRLHVAPTGLPNGCYDVCGSLVKGEPQVHMFERVIPANNVCEPTLLALDKVFYDADPSTAGGTVAMIGKATWIAQTYLKDAFHMDPVETAEALIQSPEHAVRINLSGDRIAVLMPIRHEQDQAA